MYSEIKYLVLKPEIQMSTLTLLTCQFRLRGGFPHSDISGSKFPCNSPELFAAWHVLHRLRLPRHSLNALFTLDRQQTHARRTIRKTERTNAHER